MAPNNFSPTSLRWTHNDRTGELYRVYDGDEAWAAVLVAPRARPSGDLGRRVTDTEAEETVRRRSGGQTYSWKDRSPGR